MICRARLLAGESKRRKVAVSPPISLATLGLLLRPGPSLVRRVTGCELDHDSSPRRDVNRKNQIREGCARNRTGHVRTREWAGISSGCQHRPGLRLPEHGSTRGARGRRGFGQNPGALAPIHTLNYSFLALAEDPGLGLRGCRLADARGMVQCRSEARSHHPSASHT